MPDIKKFVINLKRRPDRLELFKKQCPFDDVTVIDAFDGKNMKGETSAIELDMASRFNGLDPGEIGCFLSHLRIFNRMRKENLPYALIFEDDAIFCDNFLDEYSKLIQDLPSDTDILYLGGRFEPRYKMREYIRVSENIVKHRIENNRILGLTCDTDRTTHAYIVSNAFVTRFTGEFYKAMHHFQPIDSYLLRFSKENEFTIYNSYPLLCHSPMISDSDIRVHNSLSILK
jgi:GR25 family glycosyltransferase involved in LPS biosynthesis